MNNDLWYLKPNWGFNKSLKERFKNKFEEFIFDKIMWIFYLKEYSELEWGVGCVFIVLDF